MTKFELLDMVELLVDAPDKMLFAGCRHERRDPGRGHAYLVEFAVRWGG
jgi:hypothetical protein